MEDDQLSNHTPGFFCRLLTPAIHLYRSRRVNTATFPMTSMSTSKRVDVNLQPFDQTDADCMLAVLYQNGSTAFSSVKDMFELPATTGWTHAEADLVLRCAAQDLQKSTDERQAVLDKMNTTIDNGVTQTQYLVANAEMQGFIFGSSSLLRLLSTVWSATYEAQKSRLANTMSAAEAVLRVQRATRGAIREEYAKRQLLLKR
jgi:hypothetical protein